MSLSCLARAPVEPNWHQEVDFPGNIDHTQFPAYGMSSGGIMETRIGGGGTKSETASGADYY